MEESSKYFKVSSKAISINPDSKATLSVDESLFKLYKSSIKKNGKLATYNELRYFIENTRLERIEALSNLKEKEKWFCEGVNLISKYQPYREKPDKDTDKVQALLKSYPKITFDDFIQNFEMLSSSALASMVYYLESNKAYFEQTTFGNLAKSSTDLYNAILLFDQINLLHERTKDLTELIVKKGIDKEVKESEFVRSIKEIEQNKKRGRKLDSKVPQDLIEEIVLDLLEKAHEEIPGYNKYIHSSGRHKGKVNKNQIKEYIREEKPKLEKYISDRALVDRITKAIPFYMK